MGGLAILSNTLFEGSVVLLQAYYQKLKKVQETDVVVPQFREVFDILKV